VHSTAITVARANSTIIGTTGEIVDLAARMKDMRRRSSVAKSMCSPGCAKQASERVDKITINNIGL
jgi:hypothetical protein